MGDSSGPWLASTHDWASAVDAGHLAEIRRDPAAFAPNGVVHLVLEVLAYAAEEAGQSATAGRAVVTLAADGSIAVSDDGRGTDTRRDDRGRPVRKPVIATKDLRFFDVPDAEMLPDGHPRRGMSVVAALSVWVVHTNRRRDGAWTQRYRHGVPVTGLVPIDADGSTGTTVHFLPDAARCGRSTATAAEVRALAAWPHLSVEVAEERDG